MWKTQPRCEEKQTSQSKRFPLAFGFFAGQTKPNSKSNRSKSNLKTIKRTGISYAVCCQRIVPKARCGNTPAPFNRTFGHCLPSHFEISLTKSIKKNYRRGSGKVLFDGPQNARVRLLWWVNRIITASSDYSTKSEKIHQLGQGKT